MDIAKKDAGKRRREDTQRSLAISEKAERDRYAKLLRDDDDFQRNVVKVWDKQLAEMLDIRKIPAGNYEEMGKLAVQMKFASEIVEKLILPFRRSS